jgi:V/A-type H+-transporting ATPase subunit E
MHSSVEELTKKIYDEGVVKAQHKVDEMIQNAQQKAQEIIQDAEKKGSTIIQNAEKAASDLKIKNETEMKLAAQQSLSNLKQETTDLLVWEVTNKPLKNAFDDKTFVQDLIKKLVDSWLKHYGNEEGLNILLSENDFKEAQTYIRDNAQTLLKKGITVNSNKAMTNGFQISPGGDTGFKVSFTAEDFENYFKSFAKPNISKLLFENKE